MLDDAKVEKIAKALESALDGLLKPHVPEGYVTTCITQLLNSHRTHELMLELEETVKSWKLPHVGRPELVTRIQTHLEERQKMLTINDDNFDEVLASHGKVVCDFYADWCAPCRAIAPMVEKLSEVVEVRKCNIEESPESTSKYGITKLPTLVLFENGQEVKRVSGAVKDIAESLGI